MSILDHSRTRPVTHLDTEFRSTLEAQWAQYLTMLGIRWRYEPKRFNLASSKSRYQRWYTPDFWLPDLRIWIEVKGQIDNDLWDKYADAVDLRTDCTEHLWPCTPRWTDPRVEGAGYPQHETPVLVFLGDILDPEVDGRRSWPGLYTDAQGALKWAHYVFDISLHLVRWRDGGFLRLPPNYVGNIRDDRNDEYDKGWQPPVPFTYPDINGHEFGGSVSGRRGMIGMRWEDPELQHAMYRAFGYGNSLAKGEQPRDVVHGR